MKKKIAIIAGVSGQDGWYLQHKLLKKNYKVIGLSRKKLQSKNGVKIIKTKYSYDELLKIIKYYKPHIIFNLAGESNPRLSWIKINNSRRSIIDITINFLEIIRIFSNKTKYFNCSSSEIYGINKKKVTEKNNFNPDNPYGCFKTTSHLLVQIYRSKYKLFTTNGILFNHESKRKKGGFLINTIIEFCLENKHNNKKLILKNSHSVRDFAHADDIAEGMIKVMSVKKPDDFIISGGTVRSVKKITFEILQNLNIKKNRVIFLNNKEDVRANDIKIANNNKIKKIIKWKPKFKNKELILKLISERIINA